MRFGFREKTIAHLTDANRDFQDFAIHLEEESCCEEQMRITRNLHDITDYTMTGVAMLQEEPTNGSTPLGFTLRVRIPLASLKRNHDEE